MGRGVRLRGGRARAPARHRRRSGGGDAPGLPRAERALRRRRDRLSRPLRHRRRGADGARVSSCRSCAAPTRARSTTSTRRSGGSPKGRAEGHSKPEEVRGSTFTVTSAGKLAGLFQTPIVNHPEVAILSIGRVAPRAVVRDGEVVVRKHRHDRRHVRPPGRGRRASGGIRTRGDSQDRERPGGLMRPPSRPINCC